MAKNPAHRRVRSVSRSSIDVEVRVVIGFTLLLLAAYLLPRSWAVETKAAINASAPLLLAVVLIAALLARIVRNRMLFWCPLTWFYLQCAISFGLGSVVYYYGSPFVIAQVNSVYPASEEEIAGTNILNAVSIAAVSIAYLASRTFLWPNRPTSRSGLSFNTGNVEKLILLLVLIDVPFTLFIYLPYSLGVNAALVSGVMLSLKNVGYLAVLLMGFLWGRGLRRYAGLGLLYCLLEMGVGMVTFSKEAMLMPIVCLTIGWFLATQKVWALGLGASIALAFFSVIAQPLTTAGRALVYSEVNLSIEDRMGLVLQTVGNIGGGESGDSFQGTDTRWGDHFLVRNSFANVQAWEMRAYDNGAPGRSLDNIFVALVPRWLWADKPNLTDIGLQFDAMVKGWLTSASSLAPTFNGEAYWNGGWWLVLVVCVVIGLQFAHFTVSAEKHISAGDLRYMFVALFGIRFGLQLESWLVTKYVGSYVTIWIIWAIIARLFPQRQ